MPSKLSMSLGMYYLVMQQIKALGQQHMAVCGEHFQLMDEALRMASVGLLWSMRVVIKCTFAADQRGHVDCFIKSTFVADADSFSMPLLEGMSNDEGPGGQQ